MKKKPWIDIVSGCCRCTRRCHRVIKDPAQEAIAPSAPEPRADNLSAPKGSLLPPVCLGAERSFIQRALHRLREASFRDLDCCIIYLVLKTHLFGEKTLQRSTTLPKAPLTPLGLQIAVPLADKPLRNGFSIVFEEV